MALPKQRKVIRPIQIDKSIPEEKCKNCRGRGRYPDEESRGMHITIRIGKSKNVKPCKFCWNGQ